MGAVALLGLVVGSFLNVVIYRLPIMLDRDWRRQAREHLSLPEPADAEQARFNLVTPRSSCPGCGTPVKAWQNIPVVSYLLLRGSCAACGMRISPRYPIIEALTGLFSALIAWQFGYGMACAAALVLTWSLIALAVIDLDHQILPDIITLPLLWLGLFFALSSDAAFTDLRGAVIGALAGYLSLWSVYHLFRLVTGKEGMGYGDFKLFAALGAWLGWQMLPVIILLSALVGALTGIALIVIRGRDRQLPIPFGPFLAAAGFVALLWGPQIVSAYLGRAGI
ncbi:MAG: A24 family peptidase [Gammaproteobacteria bacterium]|nr:A24 family peptidase [Gammaproteobacteria bacterium]